MKPWSNPQWHLVLEALARKWNKSSRFFLGEFDFYKVRSAAGLQGRHLGGKVFCVQPEPDFMGQLPPPKLALVQRLQSAGHTGCR
ncbi:hypothetical protein EV2_024334 [Malus domestica]